MPDRLTRTQIDFRRPPEEWAPELYRLLSSTIDAINDDILPRLEAIEAQATENKEETALVKKLVTG